MKNIDDFLDSVKKVSGSDYKTAKELGIDNALVGNWRGRRSMPSNRHLLRMCDLAELDVRAALEAVEFSREFERPLKQAGFAEAGLLAAMSGLSLAAVTPLPYEAVLTALGAAGLYIMLNDGAIVYVSEGEIKGQLSLGEIDKLRNLPAANSIELAQVSAYRIN